MKKVCEYIVAVLLIPVAVPGYIMWRLICYFSTAITFWDAEAFQEWFCSPKPADKKTEL